MKICRIIAEVEDDLKNLSSYLRKYPIEITSEFISNGDSIPTLIVGWKTVKSNFKSQNIIDKVIDSKFSWTYSKLENEKESNEAVEKFINKSIKSWLPDDFVLFDPVFSNFTLTNFFKDEINNKEISYIYFYKEALYISNDNKNIIINIKSFPHIYPDYKSIITGFINNLKVVALSYKNLSPFVNLEKLNCIYTFENIRWARYKHEVTVDYFALIPGFAINKYIPFIMSKVTEIDLGADEKKSITRACVRDKMTEWLCEQDINFRNDFQKQGMVFTYKGTNKLFKVDYSNKRSLTGRIVPTGKYNPQNLPKKTDERAQIISRFEKGKIVVFDYTSFEARIALYFCGDEIFAEKYMKSDLHYETAVIMYGRKEISKEEREFAKMINHSILYGAGKATVIEKISYIGDPEQVYYNVQQFLAPLLKKSKEITSRFNKFGYVVNDWGTIVYTNKKHAAFNNYIQSTATEILIDKLHDIREFLSNYNSKFLFQVHDSLVFDICYDEKDIIRGLAKLLMKHEGKFFSISYSNGFDYKNLTESIEVLDYSCI